MFIFERRFDTDSNAISLDTFNTTAVASLGIISALNERIFEGTPQPEIFVLPPENGSFIQKLGVIFFGLGAINQTAQFLNTDIGRTLYEEVAEELPKDTARRWGKLLDQEIEKLPSAYSYAEEVLGGVHQLFLSSKQVDLQRHTQLSAREFPTGHLLRNNFYEACLDSSDVQGVCFPPNEIPVDRNQFVDMRAMLPRDLPQEFFELASIQAKQVETLELTVTSPNWDRADHQRMWKGKDNLMRRCYFRIEDDYFWDLVEQNKIESDIINKMTVQIAFLPGATTMKKATVLRVIKWNKNRVSSELSESKLRSVLADLNDKSLI